MLWRWTLLMLLVGGAGQRASGSPCPAREGRMSNVCDAPAARLTVTSANGTWVRCDQQVDKEQFEAAPVVSFPAALQDSLYTLIMLDPDVPGHRPGRFWLHWIVANIPGGDFASGIFDSANVIAEYQKPEPPVGTGAHRYLLLAYRQPAGRALLRAPALRPQFRLVDFLRDAGPYCLQGPLAGAQFRAAY
ncbi:protein D2-like [Schistocerca nitens]|uniref:protein D2-like n=1 Tax=Schistocerca nitens TaxID=7011 RepID=UPI0021184521|nr:protein D2-like [Schistocerca nitens]